MSQLTTLGPLREAIDLVDREMILLLRERMRLSKRIGETKRQTSMAVHDAQREHELLETLRLTLNDEKLWAVILPVMKKVIEGSRHLQTEDSVTTSFEEDVSCSEAVAYFGKKDTYTSRMADQLCPEVRYKMPYDSFEGVIDAVAEGRVLKGIVPIENSSTGALIEVLDLIYEKPVRVVQEAWQRIDHCLIGLPGVDLKEIEKVFSHEQPLKQCRRYLKQMGFKGVIGQSSSACVETVANKGIRQWAAIGSREAAERYGLVVLDDRICDYIENQTRFVVIEQATDESEHHETQNHLVCSVPLSHDTLSLAITLKHEPGSLARFLEHFSIQGINLIRLHSRPLQKNPKEYLFFVDIEGSLDSENLQNAVEHAFSQAVNYRWLGSYKREAIKEIYV